MPSPAFAPDEILPEDPGYYYSPLLPFRQKLNPDGSTTPGQGVEWGYVPGALRQAANQTWLAGVMPGNAAAGKYTPEQMNRLAPEAAMGLLGLPEVKGAEGASAAGNALASGFRTTPGALAMEHEQELAQIYGGASRGAASAVPPARAPMNIEDIIGTRIDSLERPSRVAAEPSMGTSEIWGQPVAGNPPTFAYHGTPWTFESVEHNPFGAFRDENIGTGEGAQVYGHGHYVAGNESTARVYQTGLSQQYHGTPLGGNLYKVQIRPGEDRLLDWDNSISNGDTMLKVEHLLGEDTKASEVLDDLSQAAKSNPNLSSMDEPPGGKNWSNVTGAHLYDYLTTKLGSQQAASVALADAGIPGIKYADAGSRDLHPVHGGVQFQGRDVTGPNITPNSSFWKLSAAHGFDSLDEGTGVADVAFNTLHDFGDPDKATAWLRQQSRGKHSISDYRNESAANWIDQNRGDISFAPPKKPTSNYVIFHPSNLKIVGRNGEELGGLAPVEHDPFGRTQ